MVILYRLLSSFVMLLIVSAMIFALTRLGGVSPARIVLGVDATDTQIADFDARYGLDESLPVQYWNWLRQIPTDGFSTSYITGQSVNQRLIETVPVSLELVVIAFILSVIGSIALGSISAIYEKRLPDHFVRIFAMAALSVPGFWLGLLLVRLFGLQLGWLPSVGVTPISEGLGPHLASLLLPALSIAIYYIGAMSRLLRASLIDVLGRDYTRTSVSLGVRARTRYFYALKNALPPFVSMAGMSFGYMFGWAVIVETVFNIPGVSRALLVAIFQRDYPVVQSIVIVITVAFVVSSLISDLIQRRLNPRMKG